MKNLWNYIDAKTLSADEKYTLCLRILVPLCAAAGLLVWAGAAMLGLRGWDWPLIFAGYPVLVCPVAVFLYGCRHPFHEGSSCDKERQIVV